jgi:hypothetical protein
MAAPVDRRGGTDDDRAESVFSAAAATISCGRFLYYVRLRNYNCQLEMLLRFTWSIGGRSVFDCHHTAI